MSNRLVLLGKQLISDTSSAEIRRIEDLLKQENIPYRLQTQRSRGSVGSFMDSRSYAASNIALYKGAATPTFVYAIYVRPKDYKRAQSLMQVR
ncbi:MAG TPA: DUF2007 domain-containing protein [Anaerolineaceae bacterium]|jgi:hypothetical protein|nr:DUF2007 domain-containing protein [Anaerolineaceae bacterium]HPS32103.1 DUF2007 domain-containing protein [Anaerolineaceae bacterium]